MTTPHTNTSPNLPTSTQSFDWERTALRTFKDRDGLSWFIAKDVCEALGLDHINMALRTLDEDEKGSTTVATLGGVQTMATVNESGLYSLVLRSRKPEAKQFRRWVTHTVLPAIRRDGAYIKGEERLLESASADELRLRLQELEARVVHAVEAKVHRSAAAIEEREARAMALKALSKGRPSRKRRRVVIPAGEV